MGRFDVFDGNGDDFVLAEYFDRALGEAVAARDKEDGVAALPQLANLRDPVVDPSAELHRRLAGDVADLCLLSDSQLFQPRRAAGPRVDVAPGEKRLVRRQRHDMAPGSRIAVARFELVPDLSRLLLDLLVLRHDDANTARRPKKIDHRHGGPVVVEPLADRNDQKLVGRAGGSLCRRVEPPQRFDHVADKLDACRLEVAGREDVDDAAANRERPVLLNRVFASEPRIHEKVREILGLDLGARFDRQRGAQQALRRADPRQQRRRGGHDQPRGAGRRAVQGSSASGRHTEVRAHPAIRIHLERGKRQHRALNIRLGRALERRVEKPRVADERLDVLIRRHHEQRQR